MSDLILFGDSITFAWPNPSPAVRLHRGIPGETAVAMTARFDRDVSRPRPRCVHLMAGTNDVAENDGRYDEAATVRAIGGMAASARDAGIAVLIASVPPAGTIPWRPEVDAVARIRALNAALAALAGRDRHRFVDYTPALADAAGAMRPGFADDGVHPTAAGYAAMEAVLGRALT